LEKIESIKDAKKSGVPLKKKQRTENGATEDQDEAPTLEVVQPEGKEGKEKTKKQGKGGKAQGKQQTSKSGGDQQATKSKTNPTTKGNNCALSGCSY